MSNKKPVPLLLPRPPLRRTCPVCGKTSYSRGGIHPQCAQESSDRVRMEGVRKAIDAAERPAVRPANPDALKPWHKRCPDCSSELHIRKSACPCGHQFVPVADAAD